MQEERKRILNMVKEGKLTIDEALVLLDELGNQSETAKKKEEQLLGELSTVVNFDEAKKDDTSSSHKFQSAKDKFLEFVELALQKIKEFDLDLNFGKSIDISHIFQQGDVSFTEMDIDLANGAVKLVPWAQKDVRVECEAKVYRVETQDAAREIFLKDVIFSIEGQRLRFASQQKWMKIDATVYIPQTEYDNVKVRMFNGSINSENLVVNKYKAKTANGKINIDGMTSKSIEAETANGQIEVRDGKIEDFDAETINGAIKIDGSFKKLDLQSFNGNIECTLKDNSCEFVEAKATTGSIKIYVPETTALSGELKSNLGGFHLDVDGVHVTEEKKDVVQKLIRFRPILENGPITKVLADSKTGSITLQKMMK